MFILDIDECASSPCRGRGSCTDGVMGWGCSCSEPYFGSTCEHGQYTIPTLCCGLDICVLDICGLDVGRSQDHLTYSTDSRQNCNNIPINVVLNQILSKMFHCMIVHQVIFLKT